PTVGQQAQKTLKITAPHGSSHRSSIVIARMSRDAEPSAATTDGYFSAVSRSTGGAVRPVDGCAAARPALPLVRRHADPRRHAGSGRGAIRPVRGGGARGGTARLG